MENYQHILLVTNCAIEDEAALIQELKHFFSQRHNARISLVYILPKIPSYYLQCPASLELEKQLKCKAKECLDRFAQNLGIDNIESFIRAGDLEDEILTLAEQLKTDLVLMAKKPSENPLKILLRKLLHLQPKASRKKICMQSLLT